MDLDDNFEPLDVPRMYAEGVGDGWHDGLGVDVCGNVYAIDYESAALYRITPDREVTVLADWSYDRAEYGHDLAWGSGIDGWRTDALYVPLSEGRNRVKEVVIGIEEAQRAWVP